MRKLRDISIRHKITLLMLCVVGTVLLAVSVANGVSNVRYTRTAIAAKYTALAKIVAAQSAAALSIADIDPSGAQQVVSDLSAESAIRFAALFNNSGQEVVRYPVESPITASPGPVAGAQFTDDGFLDVVEEVKLNNGTPIGKLYLRAATDELQAQIRNTFLISSVVFLIALAVTLLLSMFLQRIISAPILSLAKLTKQVSSDHNYDLRAEKRGGDELGALSDGFNTMLAEILRRDVELVQHREQLEEQVKQRTRVLQTRTEELTDLNAELSQSQEALKVANRELEAFSYSVSHDLRAPLRAIDGFSRILMQDHQESLPPEAQEYLQDIRASTQQMGRLVDDLLAFSRLSRQELNRQPVAFEQLVRQCLDELHREYQDRSIDIRVAELPTSSADPSLMKQVWINLLSNAFKYTGKCEHATIEIGMRGGENGSQVFYVKDNGVGFDMRYVHKLFGVFQRLHRAEDYEGTGVGLAIVQRIIQRHGGKIWAESEPNRGTTMSFTLAEGETDNE